MPGASVKIPPSIFHSLWSNPGRGHGSKLCASAEAAIHPPHCCVSRSFELVVHPFGAFVGGPLDRERWRRDSVFPDLVFRDSVSWDFMFGDLVTSQERRGGRWGKNGLSARRAAFPGATLSGKGGSGGAFLMESNAASCPGGCEARACRGGRTHGVFGFPDPKMLDCLIPGFGGRVPATSADGVPLPGLPAPRITGPAGSAGCGPPRNGMISPGGAGGSWKGPRPSGPVGSGPSYWIGPSGEGGGRANVDPGSPWGRVVDAGCTDGSARRAGSRRANTPGSLPHCSRSHRSDPHLA